MKITSIEVLKNYIRLPSPLTISFHTFHFSEIYYVKVSTDRGLIGWGEGAPFELITGDSEASVKAELSKLQKLVGLHITTLEETLDAVLAGVESRSLMAALDFAVHDLVAQAKGMPVYRLYRNTPRTVPNSVTVFIQGDEASTVEETKRILGLYPELRLLKIKLKGEGDVERCRAIREIAPSNLGYVLDANQGFADPKEAVLKLNEIIKILGNVVLIEEPCPKHELEKSRYVREHIKGSRIVADESCCGTNDLQEIIDAHAFHGVNIKLQKAGGIREGKRLADLAHKHDLPVMVGQMFESSLSTAASLALAVACENVILTDLDMDLDIPEFSSGKCAFMKGSRQPVERPGFGFSLDPKRVDALVDQGKIEREFW